MNRILTALIALAAITIACHGEPTLPGPNPPGGSDHLMGKWICNNNEADIYLINPDKTVRHFVHKGSWEIVENLLTISWENGFRLTIDTTQTGPEFTGLSYPPGKLKPDTLIFTREKQASLTRNSTPAAAAPKAALPAKHTLTAADGRQMAGTVLAKTNTGIKFRRDADNKEFDIPLEKLSEADRKFVETLAPAPGKAGNRVLYHLSPNAIAENDLKTIEALEEAGYLVDISTTQEQGSWMIHAYERVQVQANAFGLELRPTGKKLERNILPPEDVQLGNYKALFVGAPSLQSGNGNKPRCADWVKTMHQQGGAIAIYSSADCYTETEYLTEPKKRNMIKGAHNFVKPEGQILLFNNRAEDGYKLVREGKNDYDPAITKKLIRKMEDVLKK